MKYDELFDAVIDVVQNEHHCLTLSDPAISEILTAKLDTAITQKVVFNIREHADIPRSNIRRWLWRHNISPVQVGKVNGNSSPTK